VITINSVKTENHAVVLADRTAACSTIGYHSNSWASCCASVDFSDCTKTRVFTTKCDM